MARPARTTRAVDRACARSHQPSQSWPRLPSLDRRGWGSWVNRCSLIFLAVDVVRKLCFRLRGTTLLYLSSEFLHDLACFFL